jgi:hypothetical protein
MTTIALILAIWTALSIPAGILVGKFIAFGMGSGER